MPFHWRDRETDELEQRYRGVGVAEREIVLGEDAWSGFIGSIDRMERMEADAESTAGHERLLGLFQGFLDVAATEAARRSSIVRPATHPVVFVSHQRSDVAEAERIAELACEKGIDYWLDVHDPLLKLANQTIRPSDARYPFIIAAIIEMALLNSSHLIAVHTTNSLASKWVPYELGRVRDRNLRAANAGGWFHPNLLPRQCGDYVHLCEIARGGENRVRRWLQSWAPPGAVALPWSGGQTARLP